MQRGTEVRLNLGDIVLDGDPAPPFSETSQFWGCELTDRHEIWHGT